MPRVLILCSLLAAVPVFAQEAAKFEVEKQLNVVYNPAKEADPVRHKLDLYLPKGAKDFPLLMFVHGGTWKSGNKDLYGPLGEKFAKQGIGMAVINYRLSNGKGAVKHPDHIHDVAKAFGWLKANAGKLGVDAKKIYVSGHSAGGHLVSLLATDESYLKAEKCTIDDIRGVISISGVYIINPILPMFHDPFSKDEAVCKAASPITHVNGKHPPFLIAYGTKDLPFLDQMAEDMAKKLVESKAQARTLKLDRDHINIVVKFGTEDGDPLEKAVLEFIQK